MHSSVLSEVMDPKKEMEDEGVDKEASKGDLFERTQVWLWRDFLSFVNLTIHVAGWSISTKSE